MGYDTNDNPPKSWFAGRVFIAEAQNCVRRRNKEEPLKFEHLVDLYESRVNLLRAIRVAVGMPPEHVKSDQHEHEEIQDRLSAEGWQKLSEILSIKRVISIGGSGQYGVPNFTITNKETGEKASATTPEDPLFQKLLKQAYDERFENVKVLSLCIRDLFFDEVYVPNNSREMFYYHPAESMNQGEFNRYVIKHGFAATLAEAEEKFPDMYSDKDVELQKCFHNDVLANYRIRHHNEFWSFQERDSIYHGFCD
jgi:hypothetical protein